MSWSLQIKNGDLALGGSQLGIVTGSQKLVQDIRCFILERMGTDDMHREYGSIIDGGVDSNGVVYSSVIGQVNRVESETSIRNEMNRILSRYQDTQLARAKVDRTIYGKATLTRGEVLYSVDDIQFSWIADTVFVTLFLTVGSGEDILVPLTVSSSG